MSLTLTIVLPVAGSSSDPPTSSLPGPSGPAGRPSAWLHTLGHFIAPPESKKARRLHQVPPSSFRICHHTNLVASADRQDKRGTGEVKPRRRISPAVESPGRPPRGPDLDRPRPLCAIPCPHVGPKDACSSPGPRSRARPCPSVDLLLGGLDALLLRHPRKALDLSHVKTEARCDPLAVVRVHLIEEGGLT